MSATAARYMLMWLAALMREISTWAGLDVSYKWVASACIALAEMEEAYLRNGCLSLNHIVCFAVLPLVSAVILWFR